MFDRAPRSFEPAERLENVERMLADLLDRFHRRYYGKYRGLVVRNDDPENLGRLTARVPSIFGEEVVTGWALPCTPIGGASNQGWFAIPSVGAGVWIEFEAGDLEFPVWTGTFWSKPGGESEVPVPDRADAAEGESTPTTRTILKTPAGHSLQLEDAEGAESVLLIEAKHGHSIALDQDGVRIVHGRSEQEIRIDENTITLRGPGVRIGGEDGEPLVLGDQLAGLLKDLIGRLANHTHLGNMGAPTGGPVPPLDGLTEQVQATLSGKHKIQDAQAD